MGVGMGAQVRVCVSMGALWGSLWIPMVHVCTQMHKHGSGLVWGYDYAWSVLYSVVWYSVQWYLWSLDTYVACVVAV